MKKSFFLFTALCFTLSACIPASLQPQATGPAPISDADIQATVAAQVAQTLQSLPTPTLFPSTTPVVITATGAPTLTQAPPTSTQTQNPVPLTVAVTSITGTVTVPVGTVGTLPFTATTNPGITVTPTGTSHYQYYGTMPPNLPSGSIAMYNKSKADAYISLHCTTLDGYATVIEYPVGGSTVSAKVPAGEYIYVAWVGGKKLTGSFKLGKFQDRRIYIYKDRVEVK